MSGSSSLLLDGSSVSLGPSLTLGCFALLDSDAVAAALDVLDLLTGKNATRGSVVLLNTDLMSSLRLLDDPS
jgi:hypothetical protein